MLAKLRDGDEHLSITVLRKKPNRDTVHGIGANEAIKVTDEATFHFPGPNAASAWRFTVILRLLDLIHEALTADVVVSKRDMYYRDPALFGNQDTVDRYIDNIARSLQVDRSCLNVTAVPKGLLAGYIKINYRDGSQHDTGGDTEAMLVPVMREVNLLDVSRVQWVLVVEKEASFRSCITVLANYERNAGGLIITAKGYPDHITKEFVRTLSTPSTRTGFFSLPIYALVDFDPDGYNIALNYMYPLPSGTSLPINLTLIGLTFDTLRFNQNMTDTAALSLTSRDRVRARNMLKQDLITRQPALRADLQRMLVLNLKLELQHLSDYDGALLDLLQTGIAEWPSRR